MNTVGPTGGKRSREEWHEYVNAVMTDLRIWVQENGEKAAVITGLVGFLIAMFFKFFLFLVATGLVGGYIIWYFAPSSKS